MNELVPLLTGFALGLVLGVVRPSLRWWIGAPLAAALGVMATVITGEFETSWAFVLIDVPLVVAAAAGGVLAARRVVSRATRAS